MKKYLHLLALTTVLFSCSPRLSYNISMIEPEPSDSLTYADDTLAIKFKFLEDAIAFEAFNKTTEGIKINWDEVSISVNGMAARVVHKETGISYSALAQPATTIPPRAKLVDALISSEDIMYKREAGIKKVVLRKVRPNVAGTKGQARKIADKLKGQRITLFFPYYIRNNYHSRTFEFTVNNVTY